MGVDVVNSFDDAAEVVGTTRMNKIVAHYQECSHEYSHYNFFFQIIKAKFYINYVAWQRCTIKIGLNCVQ